MPDLVIAWETAANGNLRVGLIEVRAVRQPQQFPRQRQHLRVRGRNGQQPPGFGVVVELVEQRPGGGVVKHGVEQIDADLRQPLLEFANPLVVHIERGRGREELDVPADVAMIFGRHRRSEFAGDRRLVIERDQHLVGRGKFEVEVRRHEREPSEIESP
ncbi:MAG: hypothetical protein O3A00_13545 [Planctomycetota bacterium]|nr:hypothetical protein [Planctomycetota bacterium]